MTSENLLNSHGNKFWHWRQPKVINQPAGLVSLERWACPHTLFWFSTETPVNLLGCGKHLSQHFISFSSHSFWIAALVSPIRPKPHSILGISWKSRAEVILADIHRLLFHSAEPQAHRRWCSSFWELQFHWKGFEQCRRTKKGVMASNRDTNVVAN